MARSSTGDAPAYRPLAAPWEAALELFRFAGAWSPPPADVVAGWGAWEEDRLVGALLMERAGATAMLHGPVVVAPPATPAEDVLGVAGRLTAEALTHAASVGIETVFARPQSLDRVWVRAGFIPVPEAELPRPLRGRPGLGLFGWRGGTALWSTAGRGRSRSALARGEH
ncbi:MAG TPA: hypothetical protein VMC04_11280 [Verrucomicrobiae bacterium]|nr:hypothetical protein [Verrucomicrobiae bacterium]